MGVNTGWGKSLGARGDRYTGSERTGGQGKGDTYQRAGEGT